MSRVSLSSGDVQGYVAKNGVRVFRGIPFAAPPTGERRFKRAERVAAWSGVLDATRDRAIAVQPNLAMTMLFFSVPQKLAFAWNTFVRGYGWNADPKKPQPIGEIQSAFADAPMSEDCLYLAVHAPPPAAPPRPVPVMVWVHGGAFVQGCGCADLWACTSGSRLTANENVVTVFVNYRLGAAGWLPVDGGDTNCGLSDVLEALRWVQREIKQFGGDPDNVTVFGESAGAMLISALLVSPAAKGLFRRAILQSGGSAAIAPAQASRLNECFAQVLGLERCTLASMAAVDSSTLLAAQTAMLRTHFRTTGMMAFMPTVDGDLVPDFPLRLIGAGELHAVDLMIGWNRDENLFFRKVRPGKPTQDVALLRARLVSASATGTSACFVMPSDDEREHAQIADRVIAALYADARARRNEPPLADDAALLAAAATLDVATLDRLYDDWCGISCFVAPAIVAADGASRHGRRTFVFQFDCESPFFGGSAHALELPFVHGTTDLFPTGFTGLDAPRAATLSRRMMRAWANFARSGDPNANPSPPTQPRPQLQLPAVSWSSWLLSAAAPLLPPKRPGESPDVLPIDAHDPGEQAVAISGWQPWQSSAAPALMHFDVDRAPVCNAELSRAARAVTELRRTSTFSWGGPPMPKALQVSW